MGLIFHFLRKHIAVQTFGKRHAVKINIARDVIKFSIRKSIIRRSNFKKAVYICPKSINTPKVGGALRCLCFSRRFGVKSYKRHMAVNPNYLPVILINNLIQNWMKNLTKWTFQVRKLNNFYWGVWIAKNMIISRNGRNGYILRLLLV